MLEGEARTQCEQALEESNGEDLVCGFAYLIYQGLGQCD